MKMHDPKCRELSEHFLPTMASERLKRELAQHIQDEIESWMQYEAVNLAEMITPSKGGSSNG